MLVALCCVLDRYRQDDLEVTSLESTETAATFSGLCAPIKVNITIGVTLFCHDVAPHGHESLIQKFLKITEIFILNSAGLNTVLLDGCFKSRKFLLVFRSFLQFGLKRIEFSLLFRQQPGISRLLSVQLLVSDYTFETLDEIDGIFGVAFLEDLKILLDGI